MKKITTVLFDLDGTLLPMDQESFTKGYFTRLATHLAPYGYDPKKLVDSIWYGTKCMVVNDGSKSNEDAFWDGFNLSYGRDCRVDEKRFEAFYREKFDEVATDCGYTPRAREIVDLVKAKGLRVALATNPLFPHMATESRIKWAGLSPSDFELYTSYENSSFCKPNLDYYREVIAKLGVTPEECLMVGNDVNEDMITENLGMRVFLLTDCLINKSDKDISRYPQGSFDELKTFVESL